MAIKFRILSMDGGGLRGLIPVLILKEIERRSGRRITDLFDMLAGTSTGGLIACGLTVSDDGVNPKYNIGKIEEIYTEQGKDIFPKTNLFKSLIMKVSALKNPKYSANGLNEVLTGLLGQKRLSDCMRPVFVSSYDLNHNEALLFKYRHAIKYPENNALLVDVCRATSAAPTYLPSYAFNYQNKDRVCIDGGIYMNNPAMGAIIEMIKWYSEPPYNLKELKLSEIAVLSLGTGHYNSEIARNKVAGWGLIDWATKITDVMMQAVNQTTSYEADELIADNNFLRINPEIDDPKFSEMDDSSPAAMAYMADLVKRKVFQNDALMQQLDQLVALLGQGVAAVNV